MKISEPIGVPQPLRSYLLESPRPMSGPEPTLQPGPIYPGFLVNVDPLVSQRPTLRDALDKFQKEQGLTGRPAFVVVPPEQVPFLFEHETELDLVKTLARKVAGSVHPYLGVGIDAVWLVYEASKLHYDWNQPDRNTSACIFRLIGLTKDLVSLVGGVYPDLKVPDYLANGIDYIVKTNELLSLGELTPTNQMLALAEADEQLAISAKILKCAGMALDPDPKFARLTASPVAPAPASNLTPADAKPAPTSP